MNQYIKESVSRFLGWKLPTDFAPDAVISFKREANPLSPEHLRFNHQPIGTNLFDAVQAEAMLMHVAAPLIDRITELEAQLADAQKDAWQPIGTAPKDGTEVLLKTSRTGRIANGLWNAVNSEHGFWVWAYIQAEPNHWMPLPKPPAMQPKAQP